MATGAEQEEKATLTENLLQASLEGLEGASQPRAVTTLEEQPRHTTTHMQASTVRRGPLTGKICHPLLQKKCSVEIQLMQDSETRWSQSCGQRQWTVNGEKATEKKCLQIEA